MIDREEINEEAERIMAFMESIKASRALDFAELLEAWSDSLHVRYRLGILMAARRVRADMSLPERMVMPLGTSGGRDRICGVPVHESRFAEGSVMLIWESARPEAVPSLYGMEKDTSFGNKNGMPYVYMDEWRGVHVYGTKCEENE